MYSSFVGIDIGKWNHQAAFLEVSGKETARSLAFQNTSEGFQSLSESLAPLDKGQTVIGLEATGHYWLALFSFLVDNGWTVKVINPMQSDALRNMNIRKTKTEKSNSLPLWAQNNLLGREKCSFTNLYCLLSSNKVTNAFSRHRSTHYKICPNQIGRAHV